MDGVVETTRPPVGAARLWPSQLRAILALEVRKALFGRWSIPLYILALMPVAALGIWAVVSLFFPEHHSIGESSAVYAGIFRFAVLRFVVFFGCVAVFTELFRGEVITRSLHYYLLAPVRREVLVAGKYLAGVIATAFVFSMMTAITCMLLYVPHGTEAFRNYLLGGPGLGHLLSYLGVTVLACAGYGAIFMTLGLLFRNPVVPAAVILGWEWINAFLPSLLKKISVVHYLTSLLPVPVDFGPFALLAEPTPAWLAVPGLLLLSVALLAAAVWRVRHFEILYSGD